MDQLMKTGIALCDLDGCSGYEDDVRATIREMVTPYADTIIEDHLGNLLVFVKGAAPRP